METGILYRVRARERGVAMVEFAISIVGLLMLVALIVDGSLLFQRRALLTESGADLARRISAEAVREPISVGTNGCEELCSRAKALRDAFAEGGHLAGFTFEPTIIASGTGALNSYAPYPLIRIESTAEARCLFCSLIPWNLDLKAVSLLVIESYATGCNDGEAHLCE